MGYVAYGPTLRSGLDGPCLLTEARMTRTFLVVLFGQHPPPGSAQLAVMNDSDNTSQAAVS